MRYVRTDLLLLSATRVRVTVELVRDSGERYVGMAEGSSSSLETLRVTAAAATDAVRQAVTPTPQLVLDEVALVDVLEKTSVLVALTVKTDTELRPLFGINVLAGDPTRAAALAVLSAVNRVFGLG